METAAFLTLNSWSSGKSRKILTKSTFSVINHAIFQSEKQQEFLPEKLARTFPSVP